MTIQSYFSQRPKPSKKQQDAWDQSVAKFIWKDMRPMYAVEGEGFQDMVHALDPRCEIKSRETYLKIVKQHYCQLLLTMKNMLQPVKYFALSTDFWSSIAKDAYVTVTCHWITSDWEFEHCCLGTPSVPEKHDAPTVARRVRGLVESFGLVNDNNSALVTDNAGNVSNAAEILDTTSVNCFCHTLQLALTQGLKQPGIARVLGAVKKLVKHFNKSTRCTMELKVRQERRPGSVPLALIGFNETRWDSTYDMGARLLKLKWHVRAILCDERFVKRTDARNLELRDEHWDLLERLISFLKPFKILSKTMQAQTYATVSLVYPSIIDIKETLLTAPEDEPRCMRELKDNMLAKVEVEFFFEDWHLSVPVLASCLDPRYKFIKFIPASLRLDVYTKLRTEIKQNYAASQPAPSDPVPEEPAESDEVVTVAEDLRFGQRFAGATQSESESDEQEERRSTSTASSPVDNQFDAFLMTPPEPAKCDPLKWWKKNQTKYDALVPTVMKLFSIPASSAPAESIFSSAGHVIRKKRASLLPTNADMLVCLACNKRFFEELPPEAVVEV